MTHSSNGGGGKRTRAKGLVVKAIENNSFDTERESRIKNSETNVKN